jgi:TusA-related sulfurtransferase
MVEIWIRGRKLCEVSEDNQEAIEQFEQIVRKAGYSVNETEENGNLIKMV